MEHDTITLSQATAVATPEPTVVMPPAELELLGNQIAELSARIDAATYDLLSHLHEFDRRYGWEGWRSCAHWLNWRTGLDLGAAREKLRVAAALADLNHVSAAMARGQLSYSKVRALTRVASPATEARLLAVALCATAAQVERLVRAWRRVDRDAQPNAEQVLLASRTLCMQVDEDGMVVLRGRLPPEVGAVLLRAVEAAMQQVPATADGGEPTIAQRRADALGLVAESALAGGLDPGNPGDRFQVTVHVQADALPAHAPVDATPRVAAETRELSPALSEPVAPIRAAGPRIAAETREVSPAPSEALAPAPPRVAADTREVSLTPSEALAPAASLVAAHSARERTGGGRADRAAGPGVAAESARSPRGTSGRESRSADTAGWLPLCEESAPRPRDAKDPNHQEDRSTGIACRASLSEQATIAAPHISAETFEVSEAAFERVAPETDLDAGQAVIEQAGGLHLGKEGPAAWPAMPASWCCATPPMVRSWMSGAGPAPFRAPCAAPCSAGTAASASFRAASRATAMPITSSIGRTAGRPACRTSFSRADSTTARCTKRAFGWFRETADGQFRFLRPDGTPLPAEPPAACWEGAPLAPTDARLAAAGIGIGPHTATPEWYGESLDLTAALDVLWEPPAAVARVSPELAGQHA